MLLNPVGCNLDIGNDILPAGTCGMSPFSESCKVRFMEDGVLLVTDRFTALNNLFYKYRKKAIPLVLTLN